MTPFVRQFSQRGDAVFDPFAGFGTTLLAARLENRLAAGCEIDADRIQLIHERLARHGIGDSDITLLHGSCDTLDTTALQPFELCLTNVPYFGCQWSGASTASQLYDSRSYAQHLEGLRNVFHAVRTRLREAAIALRWCRTFASAIACCPGLRSRTHPRCALHHGRRACADLSARGESDRRQRSLRSAHGSPPRIRAGVSQAARASTCRARPGCSTPSAHRAMSSP